MLKEKQIQKMNKANPKSEIQNPKFLLLLWSVIYGLSSMAQSPDVPTPAPPQKGSIYLTHATIHTGNGKVLQDATIGFENGKITLLEVSPSFKTDETMGKVIDCTDKHIYPGLICTNSILGL